MNPFDTLLRCLIAENAIIGAYPASKRQGIHENGSVLFPEASNPIREYWEHSDWNWFVDENQLAARNRLSNGPPPPIIPDLIHYHLR